MQLRPLGHTNLDVSALGLGCNGFGAWVEPAEVDQIVGAALDGGVNFFDTADSYGMTRSECYLAQALGARLNDVVIGTKFGECLLDVGLEGGASKGWITQAVEGSLKRLGRDWIDLLQLHFPDTHTPWAETLETLDRLIEQGKVRAIGCCNLTAGDVHHATQAADVLGLTRFCSIQFEWSVVKRDAERELVPASRDAAMEILPYFPLSQGLLTGKYRPSLPLPAGSRLERWGLAGTHALRGPRMAMAMKLEEFAKERGRTLLELALGWLLAQDGIASVPVGASDAAQVTANIDSISWKPSAEELAAIDRISKAAYA